MDYGPSHAQGQDYQQRTNGTGGDMPTGYRPCPFCHSVIPWESERCPSYGRVLRERVGAGPSQAPPSVSRSATSRGTSWSVFQSTRHPVRSWWLGSIPSAVIVARRTGVDIREVGDGNMGARNVARTIGAGPAVIVAICDFLKGTVAVLLARVLGLSQGWVLAAAWAAVLGHDFPVFAHFRGGQGLATTLGTLLVLMPLEMLVALSLFGALYLLTQNSDLGASIGLACGLYLAYRGGRSPVLLFHMVASLLAIPTKKLLDRHRRLAIQHHQSGLV